MRRFLSAVVLCICVMFSVSACSSNGKNSAQHTEASSESSDTSITSASTTGDKKDDENESAHEDGEITESSENEDHVETELFSDTVVGDTIVFGSYEQDNNEANGKEPIEWDVLDAQDDRILLLSHYALDCIPYHEDYAHVSWEESTLRTWLNDTFYHTAFSELEQRYVLRVLVSNQDDARSGETGGNDTDDKVFLLSVGDVRRYFTFNSWYDKSESGFCEQLITAATPYALNKGINSREITQENYINDESDLNWQEFMRSAGGKWGGLTQESYSSSCIGSTGCAWWMRSIEPDSGNARVVYNDGRAGWYFIGSVDVDTIGVRPAVWVSRKGAAEEEHSDGQKATDKNAILSVYEEVKQKDAEIDEWFATEAMAIMPMREKADERYELWDSFLNTLMEYFEATLPEDEWNAMEEEQQMWRDAAEAIAEEHASEYEGGSAYPLELSLSYSDEMKTRVEELIRRIGQ